MIEEQLPNYGLRTTEVPHHDPELAKLKEKYDEV